MIAALMSLASVAAHAETPPAAQGAKIYQRCAACHLPNGQGVPGAFPALAGRTAEAAAAEAGRDYLVMTVVAGVMGEIEVDGRKIRGIMPAQAGLADADVAAVLNHTLAMPSPAANAKGPPRQFTAEEVAAIKARFGKATPNSIHAIRSGAFTPAAKAK
jgi:mono/diheme cytochrome c family protein